MPFPPGLVRTARGLSRRPGFAAGAILTLAVAIGVNDLTGDGEPERVFASVAEPSYVRTLGMAPVLGRTLQADDDRVGAEPVAVLSEPFWRRRFGGEGGVLGRTLVLSGRSTRVVGVMLGLPAAYAVARAAFALSPRDPATLAGVAAVPLATALVASYLPARRATRVDSVLALRSE